MNDIPVASAGILTVFSKPIPDFKEIPVRYPDDDIVLRQNLAGSIKEKYINI